MRRYDNKKNIWEETVLERENQFTKEKKRQVEDRRVVKHEIQLERAVRLAAVSANGVYEGYRDLWGSWDSVGGARLRASVKKKKDANSRHVDMGELCTRKLH